MQLRPAIRMIYQVGRVVVQTTALFLDLDDLSGGRFTRVFAKKAHTRTPHLPQANIPAERSGAVYGNRKGFPMHKRSRPMPRRGPK